MSQSIRNGVSSIPVVLPKHELLHQNISTAVSVDIISLYLTKTENIGTKLCSLCSNTGFNGTIFIDNQVYPIILAEFDNFSFLNSTKIFGVLSAVLMAFLLLAWRQQWPLINNITHSGISLHSLMQQTSFDVSFALVLIQTADFSKNLQPLFWFLFLSLVLMSFIFDIRSLVIVWRFQIDPIILENTEHARAEFFKFFIQFLVCLVFYIFGIPLISTPLLYAGYSFWLPQIYTAAVHAASRPILPIYAVAQTLFKLFPLLYFGAYSNNFLGLYVHPITLSVTGYLLLQLFIVLMQGESGGDFFLPEFLQSKKYDYYSPPIPKGTTCVICMSEIIEGEVGLTTPCGHAFHERCLIRWTKEKMECPTCREALPPMMVPSLSLQFLDD